METAAKYTPQFKDLRFEFQSEFETWLKENTRKTIVFRDFGQDLTKIHLHESGEILNCDFHGRLYNGEFVDMETLEVGRPLVITSPGRAGTYSRLIVDEIIDTTG